ncbi:ATP-binding cassette domain-containing protein [Vibrio sp. OCN044]|uniref:ATP-binding cassette domain-containing protein n=1 Tax=Vibrio tetraodonis subsp. pristinus TaxID=2695891 RepID=A0A6L8LXM8_9VIBR|nr:ABC-F family ATP-binding cassette domain-containing protein [Vibrio tetraodonis]MYM60887.1 ATP-binding cassette domain-containing protein [Vibrio tetraodonis subsp. pristinus]
MSTLINCKKVSFSVGSKQLFNELSITIRKSHRIALVGYNGAGKTHLLKLLSGQESPDQGIIEFSRGLKIEFVSQFVDSALLERTLLECMTEKVKKVDEFGEYKAVMMLNSFGFQDENFDTRVSDLSGGQQTKLMFAMAAISEPDIIFFDEPSNHLDASTLKFFEGFFNTQLNCAFVVVSHDRNFLDNITNHTIFLRDQQLIGFELPFSEAFNALKEKDESDTQRLKAEEKNINRLKESSKRLAQWGKNYDNEKFARKAKSIEKRIEKLEQEKTVTTEGTNYKLTLDGNHIRSKYILQIAGQVIGYPDRAGINPLFYIEGLYIKPGDRIAILGENGVGKSTFIDTLSNVYDQSKNTQDDIQSEFITNKYKTDGITFSPQGRLEYLDQELKKINLQDSIFDAVNKNCPNVDDNTCKSQLISTGFKYEDFEKTVIKLSGGERLRLMFLILKLNKPNLIILDEPTNHLDIFGKMDLEDELLSSDLTIIVTSHDRTFVDKVANRFLLIKDGVLEEIPSSESYYRYLNNTENKVKKERISQTESHVEITSTNEDEEILQQIYLLEKKLSDDIARKTKHQKIKSQEVWKNEIKRLYDSLA